MNQYAQGERFIEAVEAVGGPQLLSEAWESPDHLPSLDEIRNPQTWISRVAAGPGQLIGLDPGSPAAVAGRRRCWPDAGSQPPGTAVVCGVSGGADSLALLALAVAAGLEPTAVHVDHGLRSDSAVRGRRGGRGRGRPRRRLPGRAGGGGRRSEPGGPGPRRPPRVLGRAGPPGPHRRRPGRDRRVEPHARRRARRAGRHPSRPTPSHPGPAAPGDPGLVRARSASSRCRTRPTRTPVIAATGSAHEVLPLLADVAGRDVVAVIARQAAHLRRGGRAAGPAGRCARSDRRRRAGRRRSGAWPRWRCAGGCASADAEGHPPDSATVGRVLAVARLEIRSTDVGGGRRVSRSQGRLRLDPS